MNKILLVSLMIFIAILSLNITFCSSDKTTKEDLHGPKPSAKGSLIFKSFNRLPDNYQYTEKKEFKIDKGQWVQFDLNSPENFNAEIRNDVTGNTYTIKNIKGLEFSARKWVFLEAGTYQVVVYSAGKSGNFVLKVYSAG